MARVPEEEIERLKRDISLERLVAARGIALTKTGANLVGLCPFHDDKNTPNLTITPEKNVFHCFACNASGSVIDWVMKIEGLSFRHAVEVLRGGAIEDVGARKGPLPERGTVRKLALLAERSADRSELLERVVAVYNATLKENPEALAYLKARGLGHPEMLERFKLGYANRTLGYRLPDGRIKAGAELRSRLAEIGVYRETGHEHLAGSLVIPLFDEGGRVVQLYGRKLLDNLRAGTPMHLYLPGPHRGVFNREALAASDEVILCESLIDALTFWCAGFRNVTTAYGVEGCTEEIASALAAAKVRVVKIAFDRDDAGDRGAEKVGAKLNALGIETYRVVFPRGMDANEYALKLSPAEKSLELVVRQAVWMGAAQSVPTPAIDSAAAAETEVVDDTITEPDEAPPETEAPADVANDPAPYPSLAASPAAAAAAARPAAPPSAASDMASEKKGDEWSFRAGDRRWRVKPLDKKASSATALRVQLTVIREARPGSAEPRGFFVDTVELYSAKQRGAFIKQAADELELEEKVLRRELGQILLELEAERDALAQQELEPKKTPVETMTELEREEALEFLRDPKLLDRLLADLEKSGIVGEQTNKLMAYIAATSRKLEQPLAVVIRSSSAAGKSSLMEAVLALMPDEERVQYSAMTGQSLFYMGAEDLKHKILAIVEEEGAERASYALKLLQSEGELTIASTGKDPATGRLVTHTYRVAGPVMIFLTTTAIEVDEELLNRCLVLTVDEGRDQTRAIHERQRLGQTLEGLLEREERQRTRRMHKNAQRLLRPLLVVNPFAPELHFADHATRTRRDHMKYLTLIRAVALLHQHQRPVRVTEHRGRRIEYIEATREDIEISTRLAHAALGQSLNELTAPSRRLLAAIESLVRARMERHGYARSEVRFTRREVREWTQWGATQLKVHFGVLEELEYVLVHRGRGPVFQYELAYAGEGQDGSPFLAGLASGRNWSDEMGDRSDQNGHRSGENGHRSDAGRVEVGPKSALVGSVERTRNGIKQAAIVSNHLNGVKTTSADAAAKARRS